MSRSPEEMEELEVQLRLEHDRAERYRRAIDEVIRVADHGVPVTFLRDMEAAVAGCREAIKDDKADSLVREVLLDCKRFGDKVVNTQSEFYQHILPKLNAAVGPLSQRDKQYIEFQEKFDDWRHLLGTVCFITRQYVEALSSGDEARANDMMAYLKVALPMIDEFEGKNLMADTFGVRIWQALERAESALSGCQGEDIIAEGLRNEALTILRQLLGEKR